VLEPLPPAAVPELSLVPELFPLAPEPWPEPALLPLPELWELGEDAQAAIRAKTVSATHDKSLRTATF
jgi:hypothetical protein